MTSRASSAPSNVSVLPETAVIALGGDGVISSWNPAAEKLFGGGAAGRDLSRLFPADELPRVVKAVDRVRLGRGSETLETKLLRPDGTAWAGAATLVAAAWDGEGRVSGLTLTLEPGGVPADARRLERVFACALDGLLVIDAQGRIVLGNERAARIFAVPKDELRMPIPEYVRRFQPRVRPGTPATPVSELALAGHTVEPVERFITAADGRERRLRVGAAPLLGENGAVDGAVVVIADVTEEWAARESQRASEGRYRELVEGLDAIVWEADPETWAFTYVNQRAERILGYPRERWLNEKDFWVRILHPDDREAAVRCCTEAVAAGRDNDFEYRVSAADGRVVWIRDLVYVAQDGSGRLRGIMFDITERKRTAEEVRTILESTPAVIWVAHDADGRVITGNRASYEVLRMSPGTNASVSAAEGAPDHFRVFAEGRELRPADFPVQRAARGEELRGFEEEIVFDDGRRVRLLGNAVPIRDEAGAPRGAVAAFVDITERVRAEAALRELNQTLEARVDERTRELRLALEELNGFAYSVAHDLRAPLRSMTGFSDLLLEGERQRPLDAEARGFLERIRDSALRMDALIRGLLEYSRLGRVENSLGTMDVGAAVAAALAQLKPEIERTGADVSAEGPFPEARGNLLLLTQCLVNLVSNALKFVAAGERPRVEIRGEARDGAARIEVKDNGIGIPESYHDRVFGVFERLHPSEAYSGTGIGLAIVRRAVERMGGRTGLASTPGRGSTFWIELPRS